MNALQHLIYYTLKVIVRVFFALYYPRTVVLGRENLKLKGPTLVISNHPNTLIDALNCASRVSEPVFFLANAGLFQNPILGRMFRFLYCIPVERPQDTNGRPINNSESFEMSFQHLEKGGHIYIAPEGGSEMERRLRPLRTGTVRIGLGAEARHNFELNVRILMIGLTYNSPDRSGGDLVVNVAPPLLLRDYRQSYEDHPRNTIRNLTTHIEALLRRLQTDTRDTREDQLLHILEDMLQARHPLPTERAYLRSQTVLHKMRYYGKKHPEDFAGFSGRANEYAQTLKQLRLTEEALETISNGPKQVWKALAAMGLLSPVWIFSWINNVLPFAIARMAPKRLGVYIGYTTTVKWMVALILVPVFYGIQLFIARQFLPGNGFWLYLASLLLSGWFFLRLRVQWKRTAAILRGLWLRFRESGKMEELLTNRKALWQVVERWDR